MMPCLLVATPALGVILIGLGLGTEIDLIAFLTSRYFGQRAFGQLYGFCFMLFGLGSSCGRYIGGAVYDLAGSYNPALVGAAIALALAVVVPPGSAADRRADRLHHPPARSRSRHP